MRNKSILILIVNILFLGFSEYGFSQKNIAETILLESSTEPQLAISGSKIYTVWLDGGNGDGDIPFRASKMAEKMKEDNKM